MSRPIRFVPEDGGLVEITCRTVRVRTTEGLTLKHHSPRVRDERQGRVSHPPDENTCEVPHLPPAMLKIAGFLVRFQLWSGSNRPCRWRASDGKPVGVTAPPLWSGHLFGGRTGGPPVLQTGSAELDFDFGSHCQDVSARKARTHLLRPTGMPMSGGLPSARSAGVRPLHLWTRHVVQPLSLGLSDSDEQAAIV
jgi:hypothetical protein